MPVSKRYYCNQCDKNVDEQHFGIYYHYPGEIEMSVKAEKHGEIFREITNERIKLSEGKSLSPRVGILKAMIEGEAKSKPPHETRKQLIEVGAMILEQLEKL